MSKFFKGNKIARACKCNMSSLNIYKCVLHEILRENVLLLVNNVHENISQKVKKDRILKACVRYLRRNSFLANQKGVIFSCTLLSVIFFCITGSDVVDWLYSHVEGFQDRREARKYACNLLKVNALFELVCHVLRLNRSLLLLLSFFGFLIFFFVMFYLHLTFVCIWLFIRLVSFDTQLTRLLSQSSAIMCLAIFVEVSLNFSCFPHVIW